VKTTPNEKKRKNKPPKETHHKAPAPEPAGKLELFANTFGTMTNPFQSPLPVVTAMTNPLGERPGDRKR